MLIIVLVINIIPHFLDGNATYIKSPNVDLNKNISNTHVGNPIPKTDIKSNLNKNDVEYKVLIKIDLN